MRYRTRNVVSPGNRMAQIMNGISGGLMTSGQISSRVDQTATVNSSPSTTSSNRNLPDFQVGEGGAQVQSTQTVTVVDQENLISPQSELDHGYVEDPMMRRIMNGLEDNTGLSPTETLNRSSGSGDRGEDTSRASGFSANFHSGMTTARESVKGIIDTPAEIMSEAEESFERSVDLPILATGVMAFLFLNTKAGAIVASAGKRVLGGVTSRVFSTANASIGRAVDAATFGII